MTTGISFVVTGRVQGVGFRAFVQDLAERMRLTGEVWNRRDGAVEGIAYGDHLDEFERRLQDGPGRVDSVSVQPAMSAAAPEDFTIGRTV